MVFYPWKLKLQFLAIALTALTIFLELKVSKSRNKIMISSILSKNEQNSQDEGGLYFDDVISQTVPKICLKDDVIKLRYYVSWVCLVCILEESGRDFIICFRDLLTFNAAISIGINETNNFIKIARNLDSGVSRFSRRIVKVLELRSSHYCQHPIL